MIIGGTQLVMLWLFFQQQPLLNMPLLVCVSPAGVPQAKRAEYTMKWYHTLEHLNRMKERPVADNDWIHFDTQHNDSPRDASSEKTVAYTSQFAGMD